MYTITTPHRLTPEPVTGATITEAQQNYLAYRKRISGTNFDWKYYHRLGYRVEKLSKILQNKQISSKFNKQTETV